MNYKKLILVILIIILLISGIAFFIKRNRDKKEKEFIGNQLTQNQIELSEEEISYVQEDEEKPSNIKDVNITDEEKILGCLAFGTFNNSGVLSDEDLLRIVYNLIDGNIIKVDDNSIKSNEVDDITYALFNRKMSNYVSIENMSFNDGIYIIKKQNKNIGKIENDEISVAMGKVYMTCDYNGEHYTVRFVTNSLTGDKYIQSITK